MSQITAVGLDTSKHVFHVLGLNRAGKGQLRKKLRRNRVLSFFAQLPPTVVVTVLGPTGRPVPGARVVVRGTSPRWSTPPGVTNAGGARARGPR